jgi:hypothetical protein
MEFRLWEAMGGVMARERNSRFEANLRKHDNLKAAEAAGQVADSHEVRMALMKRFHDGEITLGQAQVELAKIKRGAGKRGLITRKKAFRA